LAHSAFVRWTSAFAAPRFTVLKESELQSLAFFPNMGALVGLKLVPGAHVILASNPCLYLVACDADGGLSAEVKSSGWS
jgi:hypothetical protein